ncbi:MAG: hypothetical protein RLZZ203_2584 [Cyanobacteriota bacterium]|jgi:hypothetical protein
MKDERLYLSNIQECIERNLSDLKRQVTTILNNL